MRRRHNSEREQLDLFHALPGDLAARDAQDLMAYPFFSLAKSKRVVPIDFRAGKISIRVEAVPEHGMATIWDADVLIWAASQIVEARDSGLQTSRLMAAKTCARSSVANGCQAIGFLSSADCTGPSASTSRPFLSIRWRLRYAAAVSQPRLGKTCEFFRAIGDRKSRAIGDPIPVLPGTKIA